MKIGTVVGRLTVKRSAPGYEEVRWLQVRMDREIIAAADLADAAAGEQVILVTGPAVRLFGMTCPADAIAVAVLEG